MDNKTNDKTISFFGTTRLIITKENFKKKTKRPRGHTTHPCNTAKTQIKAAIYTY